ncbi:hypothetical protein NDU88_000764 [Pleurodeles waltl]|uniref:Secreted protein n=1 Tax=Pleurodeles waltl TaxID=8319 RepID=A0AAV7WGF4_PLEWA|nr:hypothetical protein NDU88_000764 [Pleurodeles waltl]
MVAASLWYLVDCWCLRVNLVLARGRPLCVSLRWSGGDGRCVFPAPGRLVKPGGRVRARILPGPRSRLRSAALTRAASSAAGHAPENLKKVNH